MDALEESWTTGHVDATLLSGSLRVGLIPGDQLLSCTHALVKLLVLDAEEDEEVTGAPGLGARRNNGAGLDGLLEAPSTGVNLVLVQDIEGVTVVVNDRYHRHLKLSGAADKMRWAPTTWRALQVHLGPASADAPGIISYLSTVLSERNVSILNFSTFDADIILVQDFDVGKARAVLVECGRDGVSGLKEQIVRRISNGSLGSLVGDKAKAAAASKQQQSQQHGASAPSLEQQQQQHLGAQAARQRSNSVTLESTLQSASLAVVPTPLVLTSVSRAMLKESMFSLMKQLTANTDKLVHLHQVGKDRKREQTLPHDYLWAYLSTADEVSILLDERDIKDFPEDSLVVLPQRWRAVRLLAKDIPFDEVGIVAIMSSPYEAGVPLLNMSTYSTNVSLVAETDVADAVETLKLKLSGDRTKVYGTYVGSAPSQAVGTR
jgi:hypothetical protein